MSFKIYLRGAYATSSGVAKFSLNLADDPDLADQIPNGILNATVGVVIKSQIDDEKVIEKVDATLSVIDGIATFNRAPSTSLQKWDNFLDFLNHIEDVKILVSEIKSNDCEESCER